MPLNHFSPQFNNRFGKGESRFKFLYSLYLFLFQKEAAVPRLVAGSLCACQVASPSAFAGRAEGAERRTCLGSAQRNPPAPHSPEPAPRDFKRSETTVDKCG